MIRNFTLALGCTLLLSAPLFAQNGQPAPPGPPDGHPRHYGDIGMGPFGSMGAWWRNPDTVKSINLSVEQQKRLDDIFAQNRGQLMQMKTNLEQEQAKMEPLLNANQVDQAGAYAEVSKIADMRADLEKAQARMLLSLRAVLSSDQWTRLRAEHHMHGPQDHHGPWGGNGPDGPVGHPGPGNPGPGDSSY